MTDVFITIDTEYSYGFAARPNPLSREENFARSISCDTPSGPAGIRYQLDTFDRHGLRGVFFVDPMPALLWGTAAIEDIVGPIVERGHDVQLHVHTEWLALAEGNSPVGARTGQNIKDFSFEEQCAILDYARTRLVAAGAPQPVAFRSGNYGSNDDTLRALAHLGFTHETSHCPGIADGACEISLTSDDRHPIEHCGVVEVPIGCIDTFGDGLRHAQITALSAWEMVAAIRHAGRHGVDSFTMVSHSFELLCRQRRKMNWIVRRRFEKICEVIALTPGIDTATYRDNPPSVSDRADLRPVLPLNEVRSGIRLIEQAASNLLFGT